MTEIIYMTGAKGGTGTTTVCIGVGLALAAMGERTLIVDGDSACGDGLYLSGLAGMNVYTLADAKNGACRVKQAILQHPRSENLFVLPTLGCDDEEYASAAVKGLDGLFDYILCDDCAKAACRRAIVVTEPYPSSLKGADDKLSKLTDGGIADTGTIVNKVNGGLVFDAKILTPQEIASLLRTTLTGVVPEDMALPLGSAKKTTAKAYELCAKKITGKDEKVYSVTRQFTGPAGALRRYFRRTM